jgi:hypothetical protein
MSNKLLHKKGIEYKWVLGFIIAAGVVYFTLAEQASIVSTLISLSFIYVLFIFIKFALNRTVSSKEIYLVVSLAFITFFNAFISGSGDFNYFKKCIMFICTVIWLICCSKANINGRTLILILAINISINVFYLIFFRSGFAIFEGEVLLTLNFSNPNQTGMFLLNSILYLIIAALGAYGIRRGFSGKLLFIVILAITVPLITSIFGMLALTGCRSSFLSIGMFVALLISGLFIPAQKIFNKYVCFGLSVLPFVFVFIYLTYVSTLTIDVSFGMEESGKSSGTRIHVWKPIIDEFFHYLLFGDYYGISEGTGMSQMHNTHLDVYASYGIIPLIIYCRVLYKIILKSARNISNRIQAFGLFAFVSNIASWTFEASFVAGSGGLFLLTSGFLLIASYSPSQAKHRERSIAITT